MPSPASRSAATRSSLATFARYFVGGLVATAVHIGVLTLLVELADVPPLAATSIGFCLAVVANYCSQYYWAFRARGAHRSLFPRYVAVTVTMLGVNAILFHLLTAELGIQYVVAQLVSTGIVMFCNFTVNKLYTFAGRPVS